MCQPGDYRADVCLDTDGRHLTQEIPFRREPGEGLRFSKAVSLERVSLEGDEFPPGPADANARLCCSVVDFKGFEGTLTTILDHKIEMAPLLQFKFSERLAKVPFEEVITFPFLAPVQ